MLVAWATIPHSRRWALLGAIAVGSATWGALFSYIVVFGAAWHLAPVSLLAVFSGQGLWGGYLWKRINPDATYLSLVWLELRDHRLLVRDHRWTRADAARKAQATARRRGDRGAQE